MAKYTNDELLEAFGEMTLVELSEFVKGPSRRSSTSRLPLRLPLLPLLLALLLRLRKRRMSSTSSSPPSATRRSRSSRLSAPSPTSAWPRPRLLSTALEAVLEKAKKEDAEKAKAQLEEAGASVELK